MSLISELRRRNVIRAAMAYVALAWLVVQVLDSLAPMFGIGDGTARVIVILMAIGFVPVLVVSWLFELTPEGFRREGEIDHSAPASRESARRLDQVIIAVLALAVVYFAVDKFVVDPERDAELASQAAEQARTEALIGDFGDRSVAVLPFDDASADHDQAYLSAGIAEEIINLLATIRDIRVISRSSSFAFRGRSVPLAEIASRLDVRYVVEGSVRRAGDRLRVTAQMIDPHTDTTLWSENFDREFGDIFAIQDEIAGEVVDKLEIELTGAKPTSSPVDPEAYSLYLRARELVNRQNKGATHEAARLLEESLSLDDQHAAAWMLYWNVNSQKIFFDGMTYPEFALVTRDALENALEIEPSNRKARALLARLSFQAMSTWDGEARALAYGMLLDPLDPETNQSVGSFLGQVGRLDRALPYCEYAVSRDPLRSAALRGCMAASLAAGEFDAALDFNRRLREIVEGSGGLWNQGLIYLFLGDADAALEAFDAWRDSNPDSLHAFHGRALAFLALGRQEDFELELLRLEDSGDSDFQPVLLASVYAFAGRHDDAIDTLEATIEPPRRFGPPFLNATPLFAPLHEHPGWEDILRKRGTHPDQIAKISLDELFPGPGLPPTIPVDPP